LREFVAQGQAQLKFQIIAHSVVVLLQAACLALPRVLAARRNLEELEGREVAVAERLPKVKVNALTSALGAGSQSYRSDTSPPASSCRKYDGPEPAV
jgi:hypothetical protein